MYYDDYEPDPALDELLDERDKLARQVETCVRELCTVAVTLGAETNLASVLQAIVDRHNRYCEIAQELGVEPDHAQVMERLRSLQTR